ncbi:MAG TPA: hypothetical protein VK001_07395 [Geminicoccaceae bacterium]|nr:hypothetical protein [Geminicoccaceae bacterium]
MYDYDVPEKLGTEVELTFVDKTKLRGRFFVARTQRVSDVLNDTRSFVPFAHEDGTVCLINKTCLIEVKPKHQEQGGRQAGIGVV